MMTCSRRDGVADCGMAGRVQNARQVAPGWGPFPVAPHTEAGAQLHLPAAGRQREERAAHKMHRRRGYNAQRGSHVHEVFYHVSHSGRYIRAPHDISTLRMYRPAIAAFRYKSLGSLDTPCPRPGQATAIAATLSVCHRQTASQPAWTNISQQGVSVL